MFLNAPTRGVIVGLERFTDPREDCEMKICLHNSTVKYPYLILSPKMHRNRILYHIFLTRPSRAAKTPPNCWLKWRMASSKYTVKPQCNVEWATVSYSLEKFWKIIYPHTLDRETKSSTRLRHITYQGHVVVCDDCWSADFDSVWIHGHARSSSLQLYSPRLLCIVVESCPPWYKLRSTLDPQQLHDVHVALHNKLIIHYADVKYLMVTLVANSMLQCHWQLTLRRHHCHWRLKVAAFSTNAKYRCYVVHRLIANGSSHAASTSVVADVSHYKLMRVSCHNYESLALVANPPNYGAPSTILRSYIRVNAV